jgi:SAF domain-containing protein
MASSDGAAAGRGVMTLAPLDNVAIALRPLRAGEQVALGAATLTVERDVAVGHKIAARAIAAGETIVKYNCPIGKAVRAIAPGEYVHTHNVASSYLPTYTLPAA